MTRIKFETAIVADGEYAFPPLQPGRRVVVEIFGNFGGGTLTVGYISPSGQFIAYKISTGGADVTTTEEESFEVILPSRGQVAVSLSGATDPLLHVRTTPVL
jgi:hypothetical protein